MSVFPLFSLTTHTPRAHFVSGFPPSRSLGRHRLPQLREDVPCRHVYLALRPPHFVDCLAQRPLLPLRRLEHPFEVIARHLDLPQHLPQFFGRVGRLPPYREPPRRHQRAKRRQQVAAHREPAPALPHLVGQRPQRRAVGIDALYRAIQRTSSGAMLIDLNSSCSLSFPEECEALSSSSLEGEFEEEFLLA